jgi:hypothetical protein
MARHSFSSSGPTTAVSRTTRLAGPGLLAPRELHVYLQFRLSAPEGVDLRFEVGCDDCVGNYSRGSRADRYENVAAARKLGGDYPRNALRM